MRISCCKDDAGYAVYQEARAAGRKIRIRLNGIERNRVLVADEEKHIVVRCMTDGEGKIIFDREREEVRTETLRGDVCIVVE